MEKKTIDSSDRFITEMFFSQEDIDLMEKYVYLDESKIHGVGTFAKVDIPSGTEIGYYVGPPWNGNGPDRFVYHYGEAGIPLLVVGPMRFMNHSPEPNTEMWENSDFYDEEDNMIPYIKPGTVIFTTRDIRQGEEITSYYSDGFQEWIDNGMKEEDQ